RSRRSARRAAQAQGGRARPSCRRLRQQVRLGQQPRGRRLHDRGEDRRTGARVRQVTPARDATVAEMTGEPARPVTYQRVEQLAARVLWLDRYRRMLAISSAAIVAPILIARVAEVLGAEWP